ncbi:MAG: sulfatase [Bacteroidetes bacterium]|nr:sulfatase [Bacteroidota bacterium]
MKNVVFCCFVLIFMNMLLSSCKTSTVQSPNLLLISVDDLNNWIEPLGGHPQALTPSLSKFAEEAMVFTHAYCASPSCNPSRTALMTGKNPWSTGLYNNPQIWRHVLPDELTLPEYFRQHGYWTGGAGKLFHNNMPDPRSWDEYFPSKIQHFPYYFLPDYDSIKQEMHFTKQDNEIREDDPKGNKFTMPHYRGMYVAFDFEPLPFSAEETGDYSSVKWVSEQLAKEHDKPFFLACGIYRPHLPWYVPQEFFDKFPIEDIQLPKVLENDLEDLPKTGQRTARTFWHNKILENDLWKEAVQGYLASINYADELVGKLLSTLENSDYADNTIIVIFSDHGWQLGEKTDWSKFALWENVINSVLFIKSPKGAPGLPSGSSSENCYSNVSLVDIFPTLTELCGLPSKEGTNGNSLIPVLKNPASNWAYPVITSLGANHYSVRQNEWHYINYNGNEEELYNQSTDPEEWNNIAGREESEVIKKKLKGMIPSERHKLVKTGPIRWADVLSGKTKLYRD